MSVLDQALAGGATVVTPNNRLAREVAARFDAARRAAGERTWRAAQALPWTLWLDRLWRAALAARVQPSPPVLVGRDAARELWHSIVIGERPPLLNARGAARRAVEAWNAFHAWRDAGESLRGAAGSGVHADSMVFARWAERYRSRLEALGAIDAAQLPDVLAQVAHASWVGGSARVLLHGFLTLTRQQQRLVDALRDAGLTIDDAPPEVRVATRRRRVACASSRDELARALGHARTRIAADPGARVAIVVADLEQRRDDVLALADEILCPEHLLALEPDTPRPYGISLGEPLSEVPIVAVALDLIALATGSVEAPRAAAAVRSAFLPEAASRWMARAGAEREWLDLGQRRVEWAAVLWALRKHEPSLRERWSALAPPSRASRAPREWARAWSDWLAALGWPGTATLTSAQWQAREAWAGALAKFASLGAATGALRASAALDVLQATLGETLFQPEAEPARIQILGVLEAAGLSFDAAWLAGFDARLWPQPVAPNPFLSLAWQQARGVPRASADAALAQARQITTALAALADDVIVSHVDTIDEAPAPVAPLFAAWEATDAGRLAWAAPFADAFATGVAERSAECGQAPPVVAGTPIRGGAALFESQSACPFQAYARYRLRAWQWPACPEGLSARERGIVLHETLKAFWDGVGDRATLDALDADGLSARIAAAVEAGKAKLPAERWRALAPAVAQAEAMRLEGTLRAWIDEGERSRPPFRVRDLEMAVACDIEGLGLHLKIDRVDELAEGGLAIIDYKSGRVVQPSRWFGARPEGVQLAVYAHALARTTDEPIRALAYAQVRAGDITVAGLAESSGLWPALVDDVQRLGAADWHEARAQLRDQVERLACDFQGGAAAVAPRDPRITCRNCRLDALCRIQWLDDRASGADAGAGDE